MTQSEWVAKGRELFGNDPTKWRFVCPSCGHVASVQDWRNAKAPEGAIAFSCVGRYITPRGVAEKAAFKLAGGPCDYTGGGLFRLNPVMVTQVEGEEPRPVFAFDESGTVKGD